MGSFQQVGWWLGPAIGGKAFKPTDIGDTVRWYDPANGLFQDAAQTTPAVNGNLVGGWVEQSINGNDASQAGTARPTLNTSAFGTGKPGLSFDGGDSLSIDTLGTLLNGSDKPYTLILSLKLTDVTPAGTVYVFFGAGNSAAAAAQIYNGIVNVPNWRCHRRDDASLIRRADAGTPDINTHVITIAFSGTAITERVDGILVSNAAALDTGTITVDKVSIGCLPGNGTVVLNLKGIIGDVIFLPSIMSNANIALCEQFVALRCGKNYPFDLLDIDSPVEYQTFQRSGTAGNIVISGSINAAGAHDVEARFNGGGWATIATAATGSYSGTLSGQAQGQGKLEVRLVDGPESIALVNNIGIGDVFVIAGQSNPSGRGTNNQAYSHATLKAALFGNNYAWQNLTDPTDSPAGQIDAVSSDTSPAAAGSVWPLVATSFLSNQGIPVAFVPAAKGGVSITAWLPGADHANRATLYGSMKYRASLTGAKAVLWWQGETDAVASMAQATYNGHLDTIANAIQADLGVKLMPCKLQTFSGATQAQQDAINAAIVEAWGDNANVLTGPDLTGLTSDDTFHLMTDAKLAAAAALWWNAISAIL